MIPDRAGIKENSEDVVVFFDFENIVYSLRHSMGKNPNFEILMEKCQEYGRVVLARAYADWSRHGTVIAPLQASGFDPVYVPTYYYDNQERRTRKNAVDIHIAIEAIEVMFTQPHINVFILLTGDKDFIPLANALRRNGKTVIAIGVKGTTSPYMRQATDDFLFYHQLFEDPNGRRREVFKKDIYSVLVEAVQKLQREEQKTVFPQVKHTMSEMLGSFDEKNYKDSKGLPFERFKDFILEAQRLGHVKLVTTGSVNEVLLPNQEVSVPESVSQPFTFIQEIEPEKEPEAKGAETVLPAPPEAVTDTESAFQLLVWAVYHAQATSKSLRAASIKTIMRGAVHDFDEKTLPNENFAKFSDFTRAADRRGLVRLTGKGILMEIYPPAEDAAAGEEIAAAPMEEISISEPLMPLADIPASEPLMPLVEIPTLQPLTHMEEISQPKPIAVSQTEAFPEMDEGDLVSLTLIKPADEYVTLKEPEPYVSDYRMRVLVIDALRNCSYPAPAHIIGQHCLELSKRRQINLPNRRLNQLLTSARDIGLLQPTLDDSGPTDQYTFINEARLVSQFIDGETR